MLVDHQVIVSNQIERLLNDITPFDFTVDPKRFDPTVINNYLTENYFVLKLNFTKGKLPSSREFKGTYRTFFFPDGFELILHLINDRIDCFDLPQPFFRYYRDMKVGEKVVYAIGLDDQTIVHALYKDISLLYVDYVQVEYQGSRCIGEIIKGQVIRDINDENVPTIDATIVDTLSS